MWHRGADHTAKGESIIWELGFLLNIGNEKAMWPFPKKRRFPGVRESKNGTIQFSITKEEQQEVNLTFRSFKDLYIHPQAKEKLERGITAIALSKYAKDLVSKYCEGFIEKEYDWPTVKRELEKAVAALLKLYSVYPLPIFLWRIAVALKFLGLTDQSKQLFALFLKKHVEFSIDPKDQFPIDELLMKYDGTDLDKAVSSAKSEV